MVSTESQSVEPTECKRMCCGIELTIKRTIVYLVEILKRVQSAARRYHRCRHVVWT